MTRTEAVERYHLELRAIWDDCARCGWEGFSRLPLMGQWHTRVRPDVLFLALNPSFVEDELGKHWKAVHGQDPELKEVGTFPFWTLPATVRHWTGSKTFFRTSAGSSAEAAARPIKQGPGDFAAVAASPDPITARAPA